MRVLVVEGETHGVMRQTIMKDEIFKEPAEAIADFKFGKKVASVFDDMLHRSVPFYDETQRMIAELAADFVVEGTNLYDLGCSMGTTMLNLHQAVPPNVRFVGIDSSEEMLERCRQKLAAQGFKRKHELICADLNHGVDIHNASMVLKLQFIRPLYRDQLVSTILRGL